MVPAHPSRRPGRDAPLHPQRPPRPSGHLLPRPARPASDPPADTTLARDEQHRQLLDVIAGLPAMYREPFTLRHLEDWSYAEIGALLNLPVDTVETRLVRARRMLREKLDGKL